MSGDPLLTGRARGPQLNVMACSSLFLAFFFPPFLKSLTGNICIRGRQFGIRGDDCVVHLAEQLLQRRRRMSLQVAPPDQTRDAQARKLRVGLCRCVKDKGRLRSLREIVRQPAIAINERPFKGVAKEEGGCASGMLAAGRMAIENRSNNDDAQTLYLSTLQHKAVLIHSAVCKRAFVAIGWNDEMYVREGEKGRGHNGRCFDSVL